MVPRNRGKLIGQKPPLKLREVWAIQIRLQLQERLRGCDLVALRVDDVLLSDRRDHATAEPATTSKIRRAVSTSGADRKDRSAAV
jgi:hypothetical protein